ncbi:MAG: TIGR04255 family protein [Deltaproteobacteria bacterium]|nr:TIGR04255 family protein [Deltaproteobacteria bacterium]
MTDQTIERKVDFEAPPVVEVVCGVVVEPTPAFSATSFGDLRTRYKDGFPNTVDQAPLPAPTPQGTVRFEVGSPVLPRVWFKSEDERRLLQIQQDRFIFNWRRRDDADEYPTFPDVWDSFTKHYETYKEYLTADGKHPLREVQYELRYVNHIPADKVWHGLEDINRVFPDIDWRDNKDRFLPIPRDVRWETRFPLPDGAGVLLSNAGTARRIDTGELILTLDLLCQGPAGILEFHRWFDLGHEWIVRGFSDLTGNEMQTTTWGRKETAHET